MAVVSAGRFSTTGLVSAWDCYRPRVAIVARFTRSVPVLENLTYNCLPKLLGDLIRKIVGCGLFSGFFMLEATAV